VERENGKREPENSGKGRIGKGTKICHRRCNEENKGKEIEEKGKRSGNEDGGERAINRQEL
jgi:hypothetical protein